MNTHFVEVTNGPRNWGKFMLGRFTPEEWALRSAIDPGHGLISGRGWASNHTLILDLQTGEAAVFSPGGSAKADLDKHRVWVCPMFEPFLEYAWQWVKDGHDLFELPPHLDLPDAPFSMTGYRRSGE